VRNREPGSSRAQQQNGPPASPGVDDDRLRDHHIEEILSAFTDVARMRESGLGTGEEQLD
jgi:hypothetical protein